MPPSPMSACKRSVLRAFPVGCVLNKRTCEIAAAPTNPVDSLNWGHASMQQQHEIQRDSGYANSCSTGDIRGPGPRSYVPSTGTQALTLFKFSNSTLRSTAKSRITGNLLNGSSLIG